MGVLAIDPRLATSFTAGILASINPCGFVLLPAYLMYFLGMEQGLRGSERASVRRALAVSFAVSGGFLAVFGLVGLVTEASSNWVVDRAPWVALAIGAALVVLGVAMVFGYRLPITTPKLDIGERDRSARSMFVFGCAYAIASIGCAFAPFSATVLGGISADGVAIGVGAVVLYSVGMALIVTGLTVALALANRGLLRVLRRGMRWVDQAAGVVVLLTGLYLMWYWYNGLSDRVDDDVVGQAEDWQQRLSEWVQANQRGVVTASILVIVAAVAVAVLRRDAAGGDEPTP